MAIVDNEYLSSNPTPGGVNSSTRIGAYYNMDDIEFPGPKSKKLDKTGEEFKSIDRSGKPSIFNRYSIFFFNNSESGASKPEDYIDSPNRIDKGLLEVRNYPTSANIIKWSREGNTNASEYAWEDFLWCKNYGIVPNNYMVTLRRFTTPPEDDLFDPKKNPNPDIARLITWVDGETNKWENVGLKWNHKLNFKEQTADLQSQQAATPAGNELGGLSFPGANILRSVAAISDTRSSTAQRTVNENTLSIDPYQNSSVVFGPVDVVNKMMMRDRGLEFTQEMTVTFEYQLRSIDGVNPKVAMIDLLSNVMTCTMNRGNFWGGELRLYGANARVMKPFGDPNKLRNGDYGGWVNSLVTGIQGRMKDLSGGKGLSQGGGLEALKNIGTNILSRLAGGLLDKNGRPGMVVFNALLSGESTGEWHLTVGNPANPIISLGNLILEDTDIEFIGPLGMDDFPSGVKVTCKLKPARPRDRTEIIGMFSRNTRTYLTTPPQATKYAGNRPKGGQNGGVTPRGEEKKDILKEADFSNLPRDFVKNRFPNHMKDESLILNSAKHIY